MAVLSRNDIKKLQELMLELCSRVNVECAELEVDTDAIGLMIQYMYDLCPDHLHLHYTICDGSFTVGVMSNEPPS